MLPSSPPPTIFTRLHLMLFDPLRVCFCRFICIRCCYWIFFDQARVSQVRYILCDAMPSHVGRCIRIWPKPKGGTRRYQGVVERICAQTAAAGRLHCAGTVCREDIRYRLDNSAWSHAQVIGKRSIAWSDAELPEKQRPFRTTVDGTGLNDIIGNVNEARENAMQEIYSLYGMSNLLELNVK